MFYEELIYQDTTHTHTQRFHNQVNLFYVKIQSPLLGVSQCPLTYQGFYEFLQLVK